MKYLIAVLFVVSASTATAGYRWCQCVGSHLDGAGDIEHVNHMYKWGNK